MILGQVWAVKGDWRTFSLRAFGTHFQNTFCTPFPKTYRISKLPFVSQTFVRLSSWKLLDSCLLTLSEMLGFWCLVAAISVTDNLFLSPQCKNYINQYSDIAVQMMMHMVGGMGGSLLAFFVSNSVILRILKITWFSFPFFPSDNELGQNEPSSTSRLSTATQYLLPFTFPS